MAPSYPDPNPSTESARNPKSRRSIGLSVFFFIGGFAVMVLGLILQYNPMAGLGFVSMIIAFIYLNYRLFMRYSTTSLRRFTNSGKLMSIRRTNSRSMQGR